MIFCPGQLRIAISCPRESTSIQAYITTRQADNVRKTAESYKAFDRSMLLAIAGGVVDALATVSHHNPTNLAKGAIDMKLYAGNLSSEVTEEELMGEFAAFGQVTSATIPTDKYSGRPKGFGFVEMATRSESEAAIAGLNGKELRGRTLVVNEALPRSDSRSGGHHGGRGGGHYDSRRGGRPGQGKRRRY